MAMNAERDEVTQPVASKPLKLASSDDIKLELTTSDDEDFTLDSGAFGEDVDEDMNVDETRFNMVSSVGNFFGVNAQNQKAVEEVLDVCCGPNLSRLVNEATRTRITAASALGLILVLRKVARNRCISKSMTYHTRKIPTQGRIKVVALDRGGESTLLKKRTIIRVHLRKMSSHPIYPPVLL